MKNKKKNSPKALPAKMQAAKKIGLTKDTPLKDVLELGKECSMCGYCCRHGSGFLAREDLQKIADFLKITKEELQEKYLDEVEKFHTKMLRPKTKKGMLDAIKADAAKLPEIFSKSNKSRQDKPESQFKSNPYHGPCVFFDGTGCRIHKAKPLHCRIASYKSPYGEELDLWFTLNYIVNENDPESVRQFDAYLKSGGKTLPGGKTGDFVKDREKLRKILGFDILR